MKVLERSESPEMAFQNVQWEAQGFVPPFKAVLAPWGRGGVDEGAMVLFVITHMLSDGYSVVPLFDDFAALIAQAEASQEAAMQPQRALPPVRNMLALMQLRIAQTVQGVASNLEVAGQPLRRFRGGITRESIAERNWHTCENVFATLPSEIVVAVHQAAQRLTVPQDILMLAIIGVSIAKFLGRRTQPLSMIVPQRDGQGESDVIALMVDYRHFHVCTDELSHAGVALRLSRLIKERRWTCPGLATPHDMPMVNFQWTDFDERESFVQEPWQVNWREDSLHPIAVVVDQPSRESWRLRIGFAATLYDQSKRDHFFQIFDETLNSMLWSPLDLVWPESATVSAPVL